MGPAGTGKSHALSALGHAAVSAGMRVRYFAAADLVEALYRGMADKSVARIIDSLLRTDLVICDELGFAPLDLTGSQLLFRFVAAAYERRSLGIASHWPFEAWGCFLPEHTTAASMLDRLLHHAVVVVTEGESSGCGRPDRKGVGGRERAPEARIGRTSTPRLPSRGPPRGLQRPVPQRSQGWGLSLATSGVFEMAIDINRPPCAGRSERLRKPDR